MEINFPWFRQRATQRRKWRLIVLGILVVCIFRFFCYELAKSFLDFIQLSLQYKPHSILRTRARCNQLVWKWGEPIRDEVRLGPSPFPENPSLCKRSRVFLLTLYILLQLITHTFDIDIYWVRINYNKIPRPSFFVILWFPRPSDLQSLHPPEASATELFPASFLSTWGFRDRVILSVFIISPGVSATELLPVSPYFLRISATELSPAYLTRKHSLHFCF